MTDKLIEDFLLEVGKLHEVTLADGMRKGLLFITYYDSVGIRGRAADTKELESLTEYGYVPLKDETPKTKRVMFPWSNIQSIIEVGEDTENDE